jgi:hypothetical protein
MDAWNKRELVWDKTERFRTEAAGVASMVSGEAPARPGAEGS